MMDVDELRRINDNMFIDRAKYEDEYDEEEEDEYCYEDYCFDRDKEAYYESKYGN